MIFRDIKAGEYFKLARTSTTIYRVVRYRISEKLAINDALNVAENVDWAEVIEPCDKDGKLFYPNLSDLDVGEKFKFFGGKDIIRRVMYLGHTKFYIIDDPNVKDNKIYSIDNIDGERRVKRIND